MGLDFQLILAELCEFRKELASTKEAVSSTARLLHADQGRTTGPTINDRPTIVDAITDVSLGADDNTKGSGFSAPKLDSESNPCSR